MPRYRSALPQLGDQLFLTDGGLETTLIFHRGIELPDFASFHVLRSPGGEELVRDYFRAYAEIARRHGTGLILDTLTWRASTDWVSRCGLSPADFIDIQQRAVQVLADLRDEFAPLPTVVSGCIGPRGDGYVPAAMMSVRNAEAYHQTQIDALAETDADMLCAMTLNYVEEAVGIVHAARRAEMPVAISFTVETDGRLPDGTTLQEAVTRLEESDAPDGFVVNCAHPTHIAPGLESGAWLSRIVQVNPNASTQSHAELDAAEELDTGDVGLLRSSYDALRPALPGLRVVGGCCGTDASHVAALWGV